MNQPLISFTVPVYNGSQTILETLQSLQNEYDTDCEIVVVDNCSTDETAAIVLAFQKQYPHIKYKRNPTNIGYDRNFNCCFEEATGKYVWIVGDDDIIRSGAVKKVKDVLSKYQDLGFIYVNYAIVNRLTNKVTKERDCAIFEDVLFKAGNDAALLLQEYPNFITSLIFKRKAWLKAEVESYFGSLYVQYAVFLEVTRTKKSYCIADPFVENKCRINNIEHKPDFYKNYLDNFISLKNIINNHMSLEGDENSKQLIISGLFDRHFLKYVKVHKLMGGKFSKRHALSLWQFVKFNPKYLPTFMLYFVPGFLIRPLQAVRVWIRPIFLSSN